MLGDIHGNASALRSVLLAAKQQQVEALLITGDLIGYYFEPLEVLKLLEPWSKYIVKGNHEKMLDACAREPALLSEVRKKYGPGIDIALKELKLNQINYLSNLPHPLDVLIDNVNFRLCHGSPVDLNRYLYPDVDLSVIRNLNTGDADVVVFGHTHYPTLKYIENKLFINPGSVGQPRNGQRGAHWAIYQTKTREVEFKVEEYDSRILINNCRLKCPAIPYLAEILERRK